MTHVHDTKFTVAKLNNGNYQPWKFKLRMLLIREGTWSVVNAERPENPKEEWTEKDDKAQTTISLSIEDSQIVHICKCSTAKDMWLELQKVHERANLSNKLYLLRKLYQTKLERGQEMQDYIRGTLEMVECLRGIGEEIKGFHVAALLLGGLPDEYDTLVTALDARPDDELTLEYVKGKLIDEYIRKRENSESTNLKSDSAMKAQNKFVKQKSNDNKPRETRECFVCKKPGHLKIDCRVWKAKMKEYKRQSGDHKAKSAVTCDTENSCEGTCFKVNTNISCTQGWYIDSGASSHMTNDKEFFSKFFQEKGSQITIANGQQMASEGIGDGYLECKISPTESRKVLVKDVLYVPQLQSSLLSVKKLTSRGNTVVFKDESCTITNGNDILATGEIDNELFKLSCNEKANLVQVHKNCIHLWHRRAGHRDPNVIKQMVSNNLAEGIKIDDCNTFVKCTSCVKGKLTKKPFPKVSESRAKQPLDLIHTDVCGPMKTLTPGKKRYFLTFIDDFSRYTVVYLLHTKDEVSIKLEEYIANVTTKFGRKPKIIRADNGGEYTGKKTLSIMKSNGIELQTTTPYSPEQNGIAERKNRSLCESAKCMLFDAEMSTKYWGEAVMTACYVQNRLPTKATEKTPYELWNGQKPCLQHLRVFGSKAYAYVPKEKRTKWDAHAQEGLMIGYNQTSPGYRILQPKTGKVIISRTVVFDEESRTPLEFIRNTNSVELQDNDEKTPEVKIEVPLHRNLEEKKTNFEEESEERVLRKSDRTNKGVPPERFSYLAQEEYEHEPESWEHMMNMPKNEKEKWLKAANEEIKSLEENQTWILTELPPRKSAIGCKWVFKTKVDETGTVQQHKARLVAKGYSQKYGESYDATFAPVVKQTTFRTLLSVAAAQKLKVKHFDIKTAFLHGDIEEEIFMQQPDGFSKKNEEHLVCKLKKSIYGLKQSARVWNIKMNSILLNNGFTRSKADPCLYSKLVENGWMYVLIYVDDLIVAHEDEEMIKKLREKLNEHFETKDLGNVSYYLGIRVQKDSEGNFLLDQSAKINNILITYNLKQAKGSAIPMDIEYLKFEGEEDLLPNNEKYRQAVGALLYIATCTRPDIIAAMGILCRRVSNPRQRDWSALQKVMRYLKKTLESKLRLSATEEIVLKGYVDADWAGDTRDRKSTSGYILMIGNSAVSWSSRKQVSVALSSTEAEYVSAAHASQEIIWLRQLLQDFGYPPEKATTLFEDNQGCIKLATSEKINCRTKHIDVRHHHLRDLVERDVIRFVYCESENMIADALTKPLSKMKLERLRIKMGLVT